MRAGLWGTGQETEPVPVGPMGTRVSRMTKDGSISTVPQPARLRDPAGTERQPAYSKFRRNGKRFLFYFLKYFLLFGDHSCTLCCMHTTKTTDTGIIRVEGKKE